jgi:hypothetical protein
MSAGGMSVGTEAGRAPKAAKERTLGKEGYLLKLGDQVADQD